jgi:hypothetical protein
MDALETNSLEWDNKIVPLIWGCDCVSEYKVQLADLWQTYYFCTVKILQCSLHRYHLMEMEAPDRHTEFEKKIIKADIYTIRILDTNLKLEVLLWLRGSQYIYCQDRT